MLVDIEKVKQKILLLEQGKTLFMENSIWGKYIVYFTPQKNRIIAKPYDEKAKKYESICSIKTENGIIKNSSDSIADNIEKYILCDFGFWTVELEPRRVELREVVVEEGKYVPL